MLYDWESRPFVVSTLLIEVRIFTATSAPRRARNSKKRYLYSRLNLKMISRQRGCVASITYLGVFYVDRGKFVSNKR